MFLQTGTDLQETIIITKSVVLYVHITLNNKTHQSTVIHVCMYTRAEWISYDLNPKLTFTAFINVYFTVNTCITRTTVTFKTCGAGIHQSAKSAILAGGGATWCRVTEVVSILIGHCSSCSSYVIQCHLTKLVTIVTLKNKNTSLHVRPLTDSFSSPSSPPPLNPSPSSTTFDVSNVLLVVHICKVEKKCLEQ